jgi:aminoglycoside phosphotransferase (APT) family kinase protein
MKIDTSLVRQLIQEQFPQWVDLAISPVETSGWDNRTFQLGNVLDVFFRTKP